MEKKLFKVMCRDGQGAEWELRAVWACNEEHAKLILKFENKVTRNRIEFISVVPSEEGSILNTN